MSRSPHDPVAARLVDPNLTVQVERYLGSMGIPGSEARELVDVARMQLFEQGLPRTPEEVTKLLFCIAKRRAVDWQRETGEQTDHEYGIAFARRLSRQQPETTAASPEELRMVRAMERLAKEHPHHRYALEALRQKKAGVSLRHFAAEIGIAAATLRQWIRRFRVYARGHR